LTPNRTGTTITVVPRGFVIRGSVVVVVALRGSVVVVALRGSVVVVALRGSVVVVVVAVPLPESPPPGTVTVNALEVTAL
jgi:hypothetical protein